MFFECKPLGSYLGGCTSSWNSRGHFSTQNGQDIIWLQFEAIPFPIASPTNSGKLILLLNTVAANHSGGPQTILAWVDCSRKRATKCMNQKVM